MCSSTLATAASSINGPCSTPSSNPLPTLSARTASERRSTNASWIPSCTSSRFAQTHVWPVLRNFDAIAPSTAASRSASSKTRSGALPPSSSETFLIVPAHFAISSRPTSVEPVNVSLRTVGFVASSSPTTDDDPGTTAKTPGGTPARCASSASASAEKGVALAGFSTIVQPAASAGPALRVIIAIGKFHGVIAAQTPIGCLRTSIRRLAVFAGIVSP